MDRWLADGAGNEIDDSMANINVCQAKARGLLRSSSVFRTVKVGGHSGFSDRSRNSCESVDDRALQRLSRQS